MDLRQIWERIFVENITGSAFLYGKYVTFDTLHCKYNILHFFMKPIFVWRICYMCYTVTMFYLFAGSPFLCGESSHDWVCQTSYPWTRSPLSWLHFYRTQVSLVRSMGPVSHYVWMRPFADLTDVTLAAGVSIISKNWVFYKPDIWGWSFL